MTEELRAAYRVLELEPGASPERVKEAWRDLAKVWHPDRFPNDPKLQEKGNKKLKEINEAYQRITASQSGGGSDLRAGAAQRAREAAEAKAREQARAREESRAREEARSKADARARAEAEARARAKAEAKARAEGEAHERALREAEERARRLAEEKRQADERLAAEARAREDGVRRVWQTRQAAERGEARAQTWLGWYHEQGQGVPQSYPEALRWYLQAAVKGEPRAQNNLGVMYETGRGVLQDSVQAFKWYCLAAALGDAEGLRNLEALSKRLSREQAAEGDRRAAQFLRGLRVRDAAGGQSAPVNPAPARLVWIPPGTFMMGSPASEQDRESEEGPQTAVTLTRGFWMDQYEVTQGAHQALMGINPSCFTGDANRPVERVSWSDATNYCAKLTAAERAAGRLPAGYLYRLPTEAEWEYACRAGTATRFSYGDDPGYAQLGTYAWYDSNSVSITHAVGLKEPNPWGLYDMHGNVGEWCWDCYAGSLPGGSVTDPKGPGSGSYRVIRGGCWGDYAHYCRSAYRSGLEPGLRDDGLGFRAALVAVP